MMHLLIALVLGLAVTMAFPSFCSIFPCDDGSQSQAQLDATIATLDRLVEEARDIRSRYLLTKADEPVTKSCSQEELDAVMASSLPPFTSEDAAWVHDQERWNRIVGASGVGSSNTRLHSNEQADADQAEFDEIMELLDPLGPPTQAQWRTPPIPVEYQTVLTCMDPGFNGSVLDRDAVERIREFTARVDDFSADDLDALIKRYLIPHMPILMIETYRQVFVQEAAKKFGWRVWEVKHFLEHWNALIGHAIILTPEHCRLEQQLNELLRQDWATPALRYVKYETERVLKQQEWHRIVANAPLSMFVGLPYTDTLNYEIEWARDEWEAILNSRWSSQIHDATDEIMIHKGRMTRPEGISVCDWTVILSNYERGELIWIDVLQLYDPSEVDRAFSMDLDEVCDAFDFPEFPTRFKPDDKAVAQSPWNEEAARELVRRTIGFVESEWHSKREGTTQEELDELMSVIDNFPATQAVWRVKDDERHASAEPTSIVYDVSPGTISADSEAAREGAVGYIGDFPDIVCESSLPLDGSLDGYRPYWLAVSEDDSDTSSTDVTQNTVSDALSQAVYGCDFFDCSEGTEGTDSLDELMSTMDVFSPYDTPQPPEVMPPTDVVVHYDTQDYFDPDINATRTAVYPPPCPCDDAPPTPYHTSACTPEHCLDEDRTTTVRRFYAHYGVRTHKLQLAFEDAMITRHENNSAPSNMTITYIAELAQESSDVFQSLWSDAHAPLIQRYVPMPCYWDLFAASCMLALYSNLQVDFYMGESRDVMRVHRLAFEPARFVYCRAGVPEIDHILKQYEHNATTGTLPTYRTHFDSIRTNWFPVPWLELGKYFTSIHADCAHSYSTQHPFKDSDELGLSHPSITEAQKARFRLYRQYLAGEDLKFKRSEPSFFDKFLNGKI